VNIRRDLDDAPFRSRRCCATTSSSTSSARTATDTSLRARPFDAVTIGERSKNAWGRVGLEPITLHEARHTFASLMIAAGVNAKALATYMGHASVTITYDRYGHLMPGNETEAAALLDSYLERADTQARIAQLGEPSS
jgi:integrase